MTAPARATERLTHTSAADEKASMTAARLFYLAACTIAIAVTVSKKTVGIKPVRRIDEELTIRMKLYTFTAFSWKYLTITKSGLDAKY